MKNGTKVKTFDGHAGRVVPGTVAGSGDLLVSCEDGLVRLYGRDDLTPVARFYIRTQRLNTQVGGVDGPELFDTRAAARKRANEIQDSTPSKYGRLIVSEWLEAGS